MSTKYKHSHEVPTAVLAKRLDELSDAIGKRGEERDRELTRRIPAELDRDADLVLYEAAQRLVKLEAECEALVAKVEMLCTGIDACIESGWVVFAEEALEMARDESPNESLARLKVEWQADLMEQARRVRNYSNPHNVFEAIPVAALEGELRRQAEEVSDAR